MAMQTVRDLFTTMPDSPDDIGHLVNNANDAMTTDAEKAAMFSMLLTEREAGNPNAQTTLDMLETSNNDLVPTNYPANELRPQNNNEGEQHIETHRENEGGGGSGTDVVTKKTGKIRNVLKKLCCVLLFFWAVGATIALINSHNAQNAGDTAINGLSAEQVSVLTGGDLISNDTANTQLMLDALQNWFDNKPQRPADTYTFEDETLGKYTVSDDGTLANEISNAYNRGISSVGNSSYTVQVNDAERTVSSDEELAALITEILNANVQSSATLTIDGVTIADQTQFNEFFNNKLQGIADETRNLNIEGIEMTLDEFKAFLADHLLYQKLTADGK